MTNKQVAENFINGLGGKSQTGSLFIETKGDLHIIFSYGHHFPIACYIEGTKNALFNTDKYSNTTARHKSLVRFELVNKGFNITDTDTNKITEYINNYQPIKYNYT